MKFFQSSALRPDAGCAIIVASSERQRMETMTIHNNPDEVAGSDASYDGRLARRELIRHSDQLPHIQKCAEIEKLDTLTSFPIR